MATENGTTRHERAAYSVHEVCDMLGMSRPTVLRLIASGRIRAVRLGRCWRISAAALAEAIGDQAAA